MTFFSELVADLREAKAAAESHNVSNYEPPSASSPAVGKPANSNPEDTNTSDKPSSTNTTAIQPPPTGPAVVNPESSHQHQAYIPPPPPPKNLPHGWTARYDQKEGKFSYSHGVDSKAEQWEFPTEKTT